MENFYDLLKQPLRDVNDIRFSSSKTGESPAFWIPLFKQVDENEIPCFETVDITAFI